MGEPIERGLSSVIPVEAQGAMEKVLGEEMKPLGPGPKSPCWSINGSGARIEFYRANEKTIAVTVIRSRQGGGRSLMGFVSPIITFAPDVENPESVTFGGGGQGATIFKDGRVVFQEQR